MSVSSDEAASQSIAVALPAGAVEVSADHTQVARSWATIAIAHGAGTGYDHPFLVGFAQAMNDEGVSTVRFNFPYVEAGRRMPGPAAHAISTWRAVLDFAHERAGGTPVWASGKSYGGRMASMALAEGAHAAGAIYLGYPLHPPGDPAKARVAHLPAIAVPQLYISGTNDPFVAPHDQLEDAVVACQDATLEWVDGGGHGFEIKGRKRPADEVGAGLAPRAAAFMRARLAE